MLVGRLVDSTTNPTGGFRCFDRRLLVFSASGLPSIIVDWLRSLERSVLLLLYDKYLHVSTLTAVGTLPSSHKARNVTHVLN